MDQKTAKKLLVEGATFIFLDVPEGTEFGIDMKSWNTGENFRGVKMIPPGLHYIFYSSVSSTGDTAPRTGFFYNFKSTEVLVKKWDKTKEDISSEPVSEEEIVSLKENIIILDKFLGAYPYDIFEKWNVLTTMITVKLVEKLSPSQGQIKSALELISCTDAERPRGNINQPSTSRVRRSGSSVEDVENSLLPHLKAKPGTELRLTKLPERNYPEDSTAAEITKHCLDKTYTLEIMLSNYESPTELIGELAFCYICFLVGHSLEAFEHWKKLVILLCSCDNAIKKYRELYDKFITLLEEQIREIPEDFLADIVSNNNFVYLKLRDLFRNVQESDIEGRLKMKIHRFQESLTDLHGWDFSHLNSEDEDELPVIVETQ